LSNTSKIVEAEDRFKRLQRDSAEKQKARNQYETDQQATREKTARLRALRLAKEAATVSNTVPNESVAKSVSRRRITVSRSA
jgi:hypothetical protein